MKISGFKVCKGRPTVYFCANKATPQFKENLK